METLEQVRNHPRFNVRWAIVYRGRDFVAQGTMLDISLQGGRFAGTIPVEVGMRLALYVDFPQKTEQLIIEEAVVTWVNEHEFGAQFAKMETPAVQWLMGYLESAERRNSFRHLVGLSSNACELAGRPLALPCKG